MTKGRRRCSGRARPQRASSCRDNLWFLGPLPFAHWFLWAPSPSRTGVFGAPSFGAIPTLVREYLLVASGSWASVSLGGQPGSSESAPYVTWSVFGSPPFLVPPLHGGRRPLPHSPRREVVIGPATRGVLTSRLPGVSQRWRCLCSRTLLWQLRPLSLWVVILGDLSQPPLCHVIGLWVVALLSCRGNSLPALDCQRQHSLLNLTAQYWWCSPLKGPSTLTPV